MGNSCSMYGGDENLPTRFWRGDLRERQNFEDLNVEGRIILKYIIKKWDEEAWTGLLGVRIGTGGGLM
jgi:hypothetical protein